MRERISFEEAVRILRPTEPGYFAVIDHSLTLAIFAAVPAAGTVALGLFDAKNDVLRLVKDLWRSTSGEIRAAERGNRFDMLAAAHAVLVMTAFLDSVAEYGQIKKLRPGKTRPPWAAGEPQTEAAKEFTQRLWSEGIPLPAFNADYFRFDYQLTDYYSRTASRLKAYLRTTPLWDRMPENDQISLTQAARTAHLPGGLPKRAVERYQGYRARLAAEAPEFAYWSNLWNHMETRKDLREMVEAEVIGRLQQILDEIKASRTGLSGLPALVGTVDGPAPDRRWQELAQIYGDQFNRPIIESRDQAISDGLRIPTLRASYVNPSFRHCRFTPECRPSEVRWWEEKTGVDDGLLAFLAGYLTDPRSCEQPLLLLGDPGAGKSIFTRALAAAVGELGFRAVRVDLRDVPPNAPIAQQIQFALNNLLHREVSWAELADSAGGAVPIVILDGFDELLQTSAINQSDYLEQVLEFQRSEAARGRPTLAIVTSRTLVAHRARIPAGTALVRLEPFSPHDIEHWLSLWNGTNTEYYRQRPPLTVEALEPYKGLARQPLLLLMLTLYDATDGALQRQQHGLNDADLYENLLREFTRRQVRKIRPKATDSTIDACTENELTGLAVTALAMFNRGQLHISKADLDTDLAAVFPHDPASDDTAADRLDDRFTRAELLVDRFFFIHDSRRQHGTDRSVTLHDYEFMHATFGEYLVARFLYGALRELVDKPAPDRLLAGMRAETDDTLLAAVASFEVLCAREAILGFLGRRLASLSPDTRSRLRDVLAQLVRRRVRRFHVYGLERYEPRPLDVPTRVAIYTANLVLLIVSLAPEGVSLVELLGRTDTLTRWRRLARLWQAMLEPEAWNSVIRSLMLTPAATDDDRRLTPSTSFLLFADPTAAEAFLSAEFTADHRLSRLLGGVRAIALDQDHLLGTDGAPMDVLMGLILHTTKPQPGPGINELVHAALEAAAQLPEADQDWYLALVLRQLRPPTTPFILDRTMASLLQEALSAARRIDGAPQLCATVIDIIRSGRDDTGTGQELIWEAAVMLSDLRKISDSRIRLESLLTLAEFEVAGSPIPGALTFVQGLGRLLPNLGQVIDGAQLLRLIALVGLTRPRLWVQYQGFTMLLDLPPDRLALISAEQLEELIEIGAGDESPPPSWVTRLRAAWGAARAAQGR
jgi:hypothetical protein